jgi:hypothetical protein
MGKEKEKKDKKNKEKDLEKECEKEKPLFRWKKEDGGDKEDVDPSVELPLPGEISSSAFFSQDLLIIEIFNGVCLKKVMSLSTDCFS